MIRGLTTGAPAIATATRSGPTPLARFAGTALGYGGATAAGFGVAHSLSNRGDYSDNRAWFVGTAIAGGAVFTGAALLGLKGGSIVRGATGGNLKALATELEAAAGGVARATRGRPDAVDRLDVARAEFLAAVERQASDVDRGLVLKNAAAMAVTGGAVGVMLTSARLDPGILHVKLDGSFKLEEESAVEQVADSVRDVGGYVGGAVDTAGDVGGSVGGAVRGALGALVPDMPWND